MLLVGWIMVIIGSLLWLLGLVSIIACWLSKNPEKHFAMGEADGAYILAIFCFFVGFMLIAPAGAVIGWWH